MTVMNDNLSIVEHVDQAMRHIDYLNLLPPAKRKTGAPHFYGNVSVLMRLRPTYTRPLFELRLRDAGMTVKPGALSHMRVIRHAPNVEQAHELGFEYLGTLAASKKLTADAVFAELHNRLLVFLQGNPLPDGAVPGANRLLVPAACRVIGHYGLNALQVAPRLAKVIELQLDLLGEAAHADDVTAALIGTGIPRLVACGQQLRLQSVVGQVPMQDHENAVRPAVRL